MTLTQQGIKIAPQLKKIYIVEKREAVYAKPVYQNGTMVIQWVKA